MTGVFTASEAYRAGFSKAAVRQRLSTGEWIALRTGVYVARSALAHAPDCYQHALHVAALLAVLRCDAIAASMSAARIWGLDVIGAWPAELTLATGPETSYKRRDGYVLRPTRALDDHRARRYGVPVTSPARTVVDLARTLPALDAVVVADTALRQRLVTPSELDDVLAECRGWRGVRRASEVLPFADARAESALESVSRVAMHRHGLPMPECRW